MKTEGVKRWGLVMKLSKNDFGYGSSRWTDGAAFNPDRMHDDSMPGQAEYDAKALAFHTLRTNELRFETERGGDVTVKFAESVGLCACAWAKHCGRGEGAWRSNGMG